MEVIYKDNWLLFKFMNKTNAITNLFKEALDLHNKNKLEKAEKIYLKILNTDPYNADCLNNLGLIHKSVGKKEKAENFFKKCLKFNPKNIISRFNLGNLYLLNKEFDKALHQYSELIKLNPNHFQAHNNIGIIYEKINSYKIAIKFYQKALKINPNFFDSNYNLGNLYIKLKDYNSSRKYFVKSIELSPNNEEAYNLLGIVFYNLNLLDNAKKCFEKMIQLNKKNYKAYFNLGKMLNEEEKHEEAIEFFNKTLELNPKHSNALNNLGIAYNKLSLTEKAKKSLERSIEINPKNPFSYNNLGIIYDNNYDTKKAKENFEKALKIDPNFVDALWNLQCCSKTIDEALIIFENITKIDKNHTKSKIMKSALKAYKKDYSDYETLMKSNDKDHPYARSIKWILSLKKLPKIFFNKWDFFKYALSLTIKERPFYEYGVRLGHSFKYLIQTFKKGYGFDTFTGLPEDWHGSKEKGSYTSFGMVPKIKGGEFIVGKFEDTLPEFFSKKREIASLINFDADLYSSTICSLNHSRKIIDNKTILVFDEFLMNSNWEKDEFKALNEFREKFNLNYEVLAVSLYTKQVAVRII